MPGTPFRLTRERKEILKLLCRYSYLRTAHFYELLLVQGDSSQRAVRRLLRDFWQRNYIKRKPIVDYAATNPFPRYENLYWLSLSGLLLARACDLGQGATTLEKSPHSLEHDVAVTDFHLAVDRLYAATGWTLYWQQHGLKRTVNPDALFALTDPHLPEDESTSYYFLEMERSRQGSYRDGQSGLVRKLKRYAEYHGSEQCLRDWEWFDEFRVVIVVKNEVRKDNLLALLSKNLPEPLFWITTQGNDLTSHPFFSPGEYGTESHSFPE